MFKRLLGFVNPYMRYIKIGVMVAALAGAGWVGHKTTKAYYLAEMIESKVIAEELYRQSVNELKESIEFKDKVIQEVRNTNKELVRRIKVSQAKYEEAVKDAVKGSVVSGYSVGFGRVWNDSICRANGMPGCDGDPGGLASDRRPSTVTSEALLRNHGALMEKLSTCYRNLENIKALQDKYRSSLKGK
jgi:hypothetical protein